VRYYAVPPCPNSPNWDPRIPAPTLKVKKEVRTPTPPLNAEQFRQKHSTPTYTTEETTILREARKILQKNGQDLTGFPELNTGVKPTNLGLAGAAATGSQGPMQAPPPVPTSGNNVTKRAGPVLFQFGQGSTAMKVEEETDFTLVNPALDSVPDEALLEELRRFEEISEMLKLTLQNRALQPTKK
jgi:hypothetical protein